MESWGPETDSVYCLFHFHLASYIKNITKWANISNAKNSNQEKVGIFKDRTL